MSHSLEFMRRQAKKLRRLAEDGDADALRRVRRHLGPKTTALKHADCLHVVAVENGYDSWPKMKFAGERAAMDQAQKLARLEHALYHGQTWIVEALLADTPDLANAHIGIESARYDVEAVRQRVLADPDAATRRVGRRTPILHLAFSKFFQGKGDADAMIRLAEFLKDHGANVDDTYAFEGDDTAQLSALYGALGHAGNLRLARWLLENGANPDDNESLYHATELGHLDGVRLMLEFGATVDGTNALARMLDFNNADGVQLLLKAGADPNEGAQDHPSGAPSYAINALHHAARRRCSRQIAQILVAHGADGTRPQFGHSAYALAQMYGNRDVAQVLEDAGQATPLSQSEALMAQAARGPVTGTLVDAALSDEQRRMLCRILAFDDPLPHVKRLIGIGLDPEMREEMGMPAIHIAGWEGHADALEFLLALGPDLTVKNNYGGDLMGTILHGADNCPAASRRAHHRCAACALDAGMHLHRSDVEHCADPDLREWLIAWAEAHPDRVV